ncbi:hypothetical protein ACOKM3_07025 [Streptomyces sp. BH106]|uniref:hypothetical protein n=1 Tax=Streptomyces sp. BH106 TaxID=3410409 RepID=UPI003CEA4DBE
MANHIRPTAPPPTRIRVATADASSAGTARTADSVTHHKADSSGEGYPMFGANAAN